MLKKRALTVSLTLLCCLFLCFSGFGAVNVKAYTEYEYIPFTAPLTIHRTDADGTSVTGSEITPNSTTHIYSFTNSHYDNLNHIGFGSGEPYTVLPLNVDLFDYYFVCSVYSYEEEEWTFFPDKFEMSVFSDDEDWNNAYNVPVSDVRWYNAFGHDSQGIALSAKVDLTDSVIPFYFAFSCSDGLGYSFTSDIKLQASFISVPKDSEAAALEAIMGAINNQTQIIQQSIEEQYSMDDGESLGIYDVEEQYSEKLGVLMFGTQTAIEMLELFSPENAGEAVIRVPSFSIDVQGQSYKVWDQYIFHFSWIEECVPGLIEIMRTFNIVMFYIAILSYLNKVFERNFLSK